MDFYLRAVAVNRFLNPCSPLSRYCCFIPMSSCDILIIILFLRSTSSKLYGAQFRVSTVTLKRYFTVSSTGYPQSSPRTCRILLLHKQQSPAGRIHGGPIPFLKAAPSHRWSIQRLSTTLSIIMRSTSHLLCRCQLPLPSRYISSKTFMISHELIPHRGISRFLICMAGLPLKARVICSQP